MAKIVADNPTRFGAFAVLPFDDVDSTLEEIAYALDVLELDGVSVTSNIRGVYLGDSIFDPWMEELDRRSATLFIHPAVAAPLGVAAPLYLDLTFDATRMIAKMITSGAKRRFSDIKMIATHAGGAMPFLAHRFETIEVLRSRGELNAECIRADLSSFYYDLTTCMSSSTLACILNVADPSKLIIGSDYPYVPPQIIGPELDRFFAFGGFNDAEKEGICTGNAFGLIPRLADVVPA
jgi:predicted TIM-barrel fold metal-dependent hydrolase